MKRKTFIFIIALGVALMIVACGELPLANTPVPPVAPTSAPAPVAAATPTNAPPPPADTPRPAPTQTSAPAATTSCLTIAQFAQMWTASTPAAGPGPLIQALNVAWDAKAFSATQSAIGSGSLVGNWTVQPMSLVWTDLLGQQPTVPPGQGKWVPLRTQGGWGVFAAYDVVTIPTPGRSAKMCESLNPERDLSGWR